MVKEGEKKEKKKNNPTSPRRLARDRDPTTITNDRRSTSGTRLMDYRWIRDRSVAGPDKRKKKMMRARVCIGRSVRWSVCERSADLARSVGIGWLVGYLI